MDWREELGQLDRDGLALRVYQGDRVVYESNEPMLRPLFVCSKTLPDDTRGATVVDKVVGRAAAYICIVAKVRRIFTALASQPAMDVLQEHGIEIRALKIVPAILNRDKTGPCPMERLSESVSSPDDFYRELERRIRIQ